MPIHVDAGVESTPNSTARRIAARYADQAAADGLSCPRTANLLHIAPRTLRHWRQMLRITGLQAKPRGRRMKEVDRTTRNGVLALLQITGPAVGLRALQAIFRDVPARCCTIC